MSAKIESILSLEQQMASVEADALDEERSNARENYAGLKREYDAIVVPYPDVKPFSTAPFDMLQDLQEKKWWNKKAWAQQEELQAYLDNPRLYVGHLQTASGEDFYFMDSSTLLSRPVNLFGHTIRLVNSDDEQYSHQRHMWNFPRQHKDAAFSRNVTMQNHQVKAVDVVLDRGNQLLSSITDSYLRKALLRNKSRAGVQSIIQTIQQKQDDIRLLHAGKSFIVQGCAGSGKTMVLLHRLRYLLYNKAINTDDYLFIGPSYSFRTFIKEACEEFRINYRNVIPLQAYYQIMMGKPFVENAPDISELVFDSHYLTRVYSKEFIRECYSQLYILFSEQAEQLTEMCEECLNRLIDEEARHLDAEIARAKETALTDIRAMTANVKEHISVDLNQFEDIPFYREAILAIYENAYEEYKKYAAYDEDVAISPDDERIVSNPVLAQLKQDVEAQEAKVAKASIFTVASHRKKLIVLQDQYKQAYLGVEAALKEADKRAYAEHKASLGIVFENVTLEDLAEVLEHMTHTENRALAYISDLMKTQDSFEEYIGEKFGPGIALLNQMIEVSATIAQRQQQAIAYLRPSCQYFSINIGTGRALLNFFSQHMTQKEKERVKDQLRLFANRTDIQLEAYLNLLLFNSCKRMIKQEYNIKISEVYKHYWYLALYCQYLTRSKVQKQYSLLFIDEAQDLSASEIELIYKLNSYVDDSGEITQMPRMNVFGDVNQMITGHGIHSWDEVNFIGPIYELEENFRNTNQIVEFCNDQLPIHMQSVGVDMEAVCTYATVDDANKSERRMRMGSVLIVKDDYAVADLTQHLINESVTGSTIYTVKAVKGLEFRDVYVFDRDMTANEKYISYTRALAQLTVIKELPHLTDANRPLYVDGEDEDIDPHSR